MSDDIMRVLGRIEGTLDGLANNVKEHLKSDEAQQKEINKRLASLETSRAWTIGAGAGVSAVVAALYHFVKGS